MDGFGSGSGSGSDQRSNGNDRRLEIVSGKGFSGNQIHATRTQSPDRPPSQTRPSQGASKPWGFSDPEMKRKKRIAKYRVYTVEGKFKDSLKKGLRWIKNKCSRIVHGY